MTKNQVETWIASGPSKELVDATDKFGEQIGKTLKSYPKDPGKPDKKSDESVTTSQIRQVFTKLKGIEAKASSGVLQEGEILMLKPLLAYAASRHNKLGLTLLKERISWGIDKVVDGTEAERKGRFKNLCRLFEAILAYHKAHGGK